MSLFPFESATISVAPSVGAEVILVVDEAEDAGDVAVFVVGTFDAVLAAVL